MQQTLFFDTYALIEEFKGNNNYKKYTTVKCVTTYFQLYELWYNLKKIYLEDEIKDYYQYIKGLCIPLDFNWIQEAVTFRLAHKTKNLSYTDCLGYIAAKSIGLKFLTGDKEFKDLSNVEFVK